MGRKYIATLQHILTEEEAEKEKKRKTMLGEALRKADELYEKFRKR